ncbi:unnamed protein product [Cuscuta campestris]|uniref:DUF7054 domain-containing protein n=1 Tax=Cuscuta campestris TaxID=132261 RepID=A0A484LN67_9ASTE|nr:unnamed protein product [Cuscuta campestris]
MPSPKNRKGRLAEKAMSFSGQSGASAAVLLQRPRTVPDLLSGRKIPSSACASPDLPPKLTKLLVNVTVQRSAGPLHVLISPDSTVEDLIAAALRQYAKEGRRPVLPSTSAADYGLHYSQFSLESLERGERLTALGSRNFFLCPTELEAAAAGKRAVGGETSLSGSCSKEVDKPTTKNRLQWFKFTL